MVKSGLEKIFQNSTMAFRVAAAQCKKICPERLNWPDRLVGISEGHHENWKYFFLDPFTQKWCQISVRIFCVLPGTKNLQCKMLGMGMLTKKSWHLFIGFNVAFLVYYIYWLPKGLYKLYSSSFLCCWRSTWWWRRLFLWDVASK